MLTVKTHREIHVKLHRSLDELVADMMDETYCLPSKTTVFELLEWSNRQTKNPDDKHNRYHREDENVKTSI